MGIGHTAAAATDDAAPAWVRLEDVLRHTQEAEVALRLSAEREAAEALDENAENFELVRRISAQVCALRKLTHRRRPPGAARCPTSAGRGAGGAQPS